MDFVRVAEEVQRQDVFYCSDLPRYSRPEACDPVEAKSPSNGPYYEPRLSAITIDGESTLMRYALVVLIGASAMGMCYQVLI